MDCSINNLISRIKARDEQALEKIMDLYMNSLYSLAKNILLNISSEEDIEECIQDVFIEAWNNIDKFDDTRGSFKTWLLILCKFKALNIKKSLSGKSKVINLEDIPLKDKEDLEDNYLVKEKKEEIINLISSFNPTDKEIFLRRYFLDQSIEEISTIMNLSRQAIDNRLWRGRKKLKESFLHLNERRLSNE